MAPTRNTLLMAVAAMVLLGAGAWLERWLSDPATLPITRVRIEGEFRHLTNEQLQRAVAPFVAGGFFTVDVEAVHRAAKALPWVDRVAVRRLWPDTLRIQVEEQQPLAYWGGDGLVNQRGELFQVPGKRPAGLPSFSGHPGLERQMAERYRTIDGELAPLGLTVRSLAVDARRAWRLRLSNGIGVMLGRNDVDLRLGRFVRFYGGALTARADEIERVDMRYPNGFAVQWKRS